MKFEIYQIYVNLEIYQVLLKNMTIEKYYHLKNMTHKKKAIEKI